MEHVVFFPAQDGSPAFCRVPSLEEAVRLVEHLRNVEGVAEASVHALTEVPLAFRAYYEVEVPTAAPAAAPVVEELVPAQAEAPEPVAEDAEQEAAEQVVPEPVLVPAVAGATTPGPASLGFFA